MGTAERRDNTINSILDRLDQAIEKMSLKIDDRSLANGTNQSSHDRQSYQPSLHRPPPYRPAPHRPPSHHPPPMYSLQHSHFSEFFYEEELRCSNYQYNDDYEDRGMFYDRQRRFVNPTLVGDADFQTLIGL